MAANEAAAALFTAIEEAAKEAAELPNGVGRSSILKDLAVAYRYVKGGPQPGGTTVER